MTRACSLNRLAVYATFLSNLIRAAKKDDTVKVALQSLRDIFHTGVALNKEDEEWAYANGLKVIVCSINSDLSCHSFPSLEELVFDHGDWTSAQSW